MVTVGSILGGTWRFVIANWRAILVWSAINLALGIVMRLLMAPIYEAQAAVIVSAPPGAPPPFPFPIGTFLLIFVPILALVLVQYNAVFRAVLFQEESKAAYLRLGMDEARLLGLVLILFVAAMAIEVVAGIVITLVGTLLGVALGLTRGTMIGVIAVLILAVLIAFIFLSVRMSVAAPLTLSSRKIMIGPAWRLTRGRFWQLFGAFFLVFVATMILCLIFVLPQMQASLAAIGKPGDPAAARQLAELQAAQMRLDLSPLGIVKLIVTAALGGIMLAVLGGLPAVATAQLLDEKAGRL